MANLRFHLHLNSVSSEPAAGQNEPVDARVFSPSRRPTYDNLARRGLIDESETPMPLAIISLILVSVMLSALAQIALKIGMSSAPVSAALSDGSVWKISLSIISTPYVLIGLASYGVSMIVWLFVLAKVDVSLAYPFVSVGFLITLAMGVLLLGEHLSALRVLGTLLVAVGVILVSQS